MASLYCAEDQIDRAAQFTSRSFIWISKFFLHLMNLGRCPMPRGDKSAYTDKQKRKAEHIEEGYEDRSVPEKEAERRAWARC